MSLSFGRKMDSYHCAKDISLCINSFNLTFCSTGNNTCVEGHGYCVFNETIKPACVCLPCFIGERCEKETVSKNLWYISIPFDELAANGKTIQRIIVIVFGAFLVFNGILCLQTYLCRNIRRTNLGIYLIMLSFVSILIGIMHLIFPLLLLHIKELPQPELLADLHCLQGKFIHTSLVSMYNWFIASVATERMLVECFTNHYDLHDARRRSIISSSVIVIVCLLTTLPGVFTVRQNLLPNSRLVQCMDFTPLGYILYETITRIHVFAFYFINILVNIIVLRHLFKYHQRLVDNNSLPVDIWAILQKHEDFFIPYLVQVLGELPSLLMDSIMTCSTANTTLVARIYLAFSASQVLPCTMTFYLYIYLSPVYWLEFWDSFPIGKCLTNLKKKV